MSDDLRNTFRHGMSPPHGRAWPGFFSWWEIGGIVFAVALWRETGDMEQPPVPVLLPLCTL